MATTSNKKRVLVIQPLHPAGMEMLRARDDIEIIECDSLDENIIAEAAKDVHAMTVRGATITAGRERIARKRQKIANVESNPAAPKNTRPLRDDLRRGAASGEIAKKTVCTTRLVRIPIAAPKSGSLLRRRPALAKIGFTP